MRSCLTIILITFILFITSFAHATGINVVVNGVSGEMQENVLAFLRVNSLKDNQAFTEVELRRLHRTAPSQIQKALAPFGFYESTIDSKLTKNEKGWDVTYNIALGEPIVVTSLSFKVTGEGEASEELMALVETFPLQVGTVLDQRKYDNAKKKMTNAALSNGYMAAKFSESEIKIDRKKKAADIILSFNSGNLFYFGEVSSSQEVILPVKLKKYISFNLGDPYKKRQMGELQRALYKTGYFLNVMVKGEIDKAENYHIPITLKLTPIDKLNQYNLGAGFATDTGLHGKVEWKNKLLNKRGHKLKSSLQIAERQSEFSFFYSIPVLNPRYDSHILGASYYEESWDDTTTKLLAVGATINHDGPTYKYGTSLEFRDEAYNVGVTKGDAFLVMPSANWSVVFADSLSKTDLGIKLWANVRGASDVALSDQSFIQSDGGAKAIFSPFPKWRLIGRISVGATWVDSIDDLPPSLRFYTGGDQTIRGYAYKSLGPEDSSGTLVGGKSLLVESIEVERELDHIWSLATFIDSGNAMNSFEDELEQGAGVGVRIRLPFGQIRFDVACAISDADLPVRAHLTVGGDL